MLHKKSCLLNKYHIHRAAKFNPQLKNINEAKLMLVYRFLTGKKMAMNERLTPEMEMYGFERIAY